MLQPYLKFGSGSEFSAVSGRPQSMVETVWFLSVILAANKRIEISSHLNDFSYSTTYHESFVHMMDTALALETGVH